MKTFIILLVAWFLTACSLVNLTTEPKLCGKKIAFTFEQGNCLACHAIADGEFPGNIGPELAHLSTRFQNKTQLRALIWDASQFNPKTSMPPFGKNKILTEAEIDAVVDYLWDLK